jgi:hypothetical protein
MENGERLKWFKSERKERWNQEIPRGKREKGKGKLEKGN